MLETNLNSGGAIVAILKAVGLMDDAL